MRNEEEQNDTSVETRHALSLPALRFPEFQDSGEWEEKTLGEVSSLTKGKGLPKSEIVFDGKNLCIHYGELFTQYSEVISNVKSRTNCNDGVVSKKNDVLMPTSDVTPNGLAKASCIQVDNVLIGGDVLIIRPDSNIINGEFLSRIIRFNEREVLKLVSGTTVYHLYASALEKLRICFPSLPEQRKIAGCLSSLDEWITAEGEKLEALKAHKKGLMQQLFPAQGETVPRLRFPEFQDSEEWEEKTLGEIGNFIGGGTPDTTNAEYWDGEIQWFTPTEVKEGEVIKSKRTITIAGLQNSSAKLLPIGTILITTRATIGDVAITQGECCTNQGFQSLVVHNTEINKFWYYWILQHKSELLHRASGSTFAEIGKNEITKIPVLRPPKDEQRKIADCLSSLDELITAQGEKVVLLKAHKKGLMQRLFP